MWIENFEYKKSLGQNFIYDADFLSSIVRELKITKGEHIVEIGTGAGTLTRSLADTGASIKTVEVDTRLKSYLENEFRNDKNIELVFADATKIDFSTEPKFRLVANVPYYITTPLIFQFLALPNCTEIDILVAEDVAKRIVAKPATAEYSALSVACQNACDCKIIRSVGRHLFIPVPKIDSAFICMTKKSTIHRISGDILKGLFATRRKTIQNGLMTTLKIDKATATAILSACNIAPTTRAETLPPSKFVELQQIVTKFDK